MGVPPQSLDIVNVTHVSIMRFIGVVGTSDGLSGGVMLIWMPST
jgi:hypothetical protein